MGDKFFHHQKDKSAKPLALIVGGVGSVSSYLAELLLLKNCRVIVFDELRSCQKDNYRKCFSFSDFKLCQDHREDLTEKIAPVDYLFHLLFSERLVSSDKKPLPVEAYLQLAAKSDAKFLFASSLTDSRSDSTVKSYEAQVIKSSQEKNINVRVVHLGFVYGPRMDLKKKDFLTTLFVQAARKKSLKIPGDSQAEIRPTFISDVVYGLSKAMFSFKTDGEIFGLFNQEKTTLLAAAQEIVKQSPGNLKIKTVAANKFPPVRSLSPQFFSRAEKKQKKLHWQAKVKLAEGVSQTLAFLDRKTLPRSAGLVSKIKGRKRISLKKKFRKPEVSGRFLAFALILFILFYPLLSLGLNSYWGVHNLKKTQAAFSEADFTKMARKARASQKAFQRARRNLGIPFFFLDLLEQRSLKKRISKLYTAGDNLSQAVFQTSLAIESGSGLAAQILHNQPGGIEEKIKEIKTSLDYAYERLSLAEAEIEAEEKLLPEEIPLHAGRQLLWQAKEGITILPDLIGLNGRRTYLVLLQNNMELRPTGGFIGSYALVTFIDGGLIDFQVEDVYQVDGQLKGHVEPPRELKKYLGEANWYLRDSNWDPDFPTSALRAEWFFNKETGRSVDGVIGVNLFLAENLLRELGGVYLTDYQEEITNDNLFERAEYYSEIGFFPGSTQKKDFLSSLSRALFEKIKTSQAEIWLALARAAYSSLQEKDLLLAFFQPETMTVVSELGWDGRVKEIICQAVNQNCYLDYLMVVEANLGVNKANYFLRRYLTQEAVINAEGTVRKTLRIQYDNQSPDESFPAGRYKNYLRILVPSGSKLETILISGAKVPPANISRSTIAGKTSFGFLVEVPIQSQKLVEIEYYLPEKINFEQPGQYFFLLQKQPGIREPEFHYQLSLPEGIAAFGVQPEASQALNLYTFKPSFDQDLIFEANLVK